MVKWKEKLIGKTADICGRLADCGQQISGVFPER